MSKIIEALKAHTEEKNLKETKTEYELTQQQLADIYFSATGKSAKELPPPLVIKVVEKQGAANLVPWIITSLAFLITAFSLFSTKRIFVDIKVIDEKNPYANRLTAEGVPPAEEIAPPPASEPVVSASGKIAMQDFVFEGAGKLKSTNDKDTLVLVNSSVAPFARANLYLTAPLDLSGQKIVFYAKGQKGGENIAFALKDKENILAFPKGKIYPFPDRLTTGWQKAEIQIDPDTAKEFDARSVTNMRFEFGSKDTGNKPNDTVFIKDLQWVKKEVAG